MKPAIAPIGLDYLADALFAAGHCVRLLDLCFTDDIATDIALTCRSFSADVIGVTVRNTDDCYYTSQAFFLPEIKRIIESLRQHSHAPILLGGVGFSIQPEAVMEFCGADFGIAGDGEAALVKFLDALAHGKPWETVPNLLFRHNGGIRRNRTEFADLALLPLRRRALVDNPRYFVAGGQAGFETKRGCPMHCIYCADPVAKGRTTRCLAPAAVVAELTALLAQGVDCFHTCDSEFNLPAEHAIAVCREIVRAGLGGKIRWYAYCAPKPFDDEMAAWLRRAGCVGIDFGADSGSDEMLARLGRAFRAEDLADTARICRRHGIRFMFDLLVGGPGETRQTLQETVTLMRRLQPDCVGVSIGMRVYPGTPATDLFRVNGAPQTSPDLLKPAFYVSPALGPQIADIVRELVAGDPRFFLPTPSPQNPNYNYNDNTVLVQAIANGARGAYWDILSRIRKQ
ncbi:MAG: cobalamin-dependent protein [Verrucomicrobiae bacterium]|nr:cobalamin-dependent protein [Verrucomicrobiae bacterium]